MRLLQSCLFWMLVLDIGSQWWSLSGTPCLSRWTPPSQFVPRTVVHGRCGSCALCFSHGLLAACAELLSWFCCTDAGLSSFPSCRTSTWQTSLSMVGVPSRHAIARQLLGSIAISVVLLSASQCRSSYWHAWGVVFAIAKCLFERFCTVPSMCHMYPPSCCSFRWESEPCCASLLLQDRPHHAPFAGRCGFGLWLFGSSVAWLLCMCSAPHGCSRRQISASVLSRTQVATQEAQVSHWMQSVQCCDQCGCTPVVLRPGLHLATLPYMCHCYRATCFPARSRTSGAHRFQQLRHAAIWSHWRWSPACRCGSFWGNLDGRCWQSVRLGERHRWRLRLSLLWQHHHSAPGLWSCCDGHAHCPARIFNPNFWHACCRSLAADFWLCGVWQCMRVGTVHSQTGGPHRPRNSSIVCPGAFCFGSMAQAEPYGLPWSHAFVVHPGSRHGPVPTAGRF